MDTLDFNKAAQNAQNIPQNQQEKLMQEQEKREQILEARRMRMRTLLTVEAQERLNRIAMVKPEKAAQIEDFLLKTMSARIANGKMTDGELKDLIERMSERNPSTVSNIKIMRKRWNDDSDSDVDLDL